MKFQIAIKQMQLVTQLKMSISISISISIGKQIFTHRIELVIYRTHRTYADRGKGRGNGRDSDPCCINQQLSPVLCFVEPTYGVWYGIYFVCSREIETFCNKWRQFPLGSVHFFYVQINFNKFFS